MVYFSVVAYGLFKGIVSIEAVASPPIHEVVELLAVFLLTHLTGRQRIVGMTRQLLLHP